MYILILNFLLYFITFIKVYKREGGLTINSGIFLFISFIALCGVLVHDTEYYLWGDYNVFGGFTRNEMSFIPLLFLYIAYMIYYGSIKRVNSNEVEKVAPLKPWALNTIYYLNILIFIIIILAFRESASAAALDFGEAYDDRDILASSQLGSLGVYAMTITAGLSTSQVLIPLYLLKEKGVKNYVKSIIFILIFFYASYIRGSLIASRGILFFSLLNMMFAFLFFYKMLDAKIRKFIITILLVILVLFGIVSVAISIGRFGEDFLLLIVGYFGEPFLNFPLIYWDYPQFLNGRLLFSSMGLATLETSYLEVALYYFRTLPGSFYLDFGAIGALIFIACYSSFFKRIIGRGSSVMSMDKLLIYFYIVFGFIYGVFGFSAYGWSGYLILILNYYVFKLGTIRQDNSDNNDLES